MDLDLRLWVSKTIFAIKEKGFLVEIYPKEYVSVWMTIPKAEKWNYWNKFLISKEATLMGQKGFQSMFKSSLIKLLSIPQSYI